MPYELLRDGTTERVHHCRAWQWPRARRGSLARCTRCGTLYERGWFRWFLHKYTAEAMGFPPLGRASEGGEG